MKTLVHRALMMIALVGAAGSADAASAQDVGARCSAFQVASTSAVTMTKTCSDAVYVRRNQDEANAICVATANETARIVDGWMALKDLPETKSTPCATPKEAGAVSLYAAMKWQLKMLGALNDGAPQPGPFAEP